MTLHIPEVAGTLTAFSLLTADTIAMQAQQPIVPIPEPHSTGNPWADVVLFALRVVGILGAVSAPTIIGKWIEHRREDQRLLKEKAKEEKP